MAIPFCLQRPRLIFFFCLSLRSLHIPRWLLELRSSGPCSRPSSRERGRKGQGCLPLTFIEPFQKSHRTLLIMFLWSSFYRMATSHCKEGWEVPFFSQVYCPGFTKEEGEDGCKLYAESKRPGNKKSTYCIILLI